MIPERYTPQVYALFRIVFGFVFLVFGLQKTIPWFTGGGPDVFGMQGAAGIGLWFLQLDAAERGRTLSLRFPDEPR